MPQFHLILVLLSPSWLSFGLVVLLTGLIVGMANWSYFTYSSGLYDFFYGEHGVITTLELAPDAVNALQQNVANNMTLYGLGVIGVAITVAVVLFWLLRGAERGAQLASHLGNGVERREYLQHALMRLALGGLWIVYALLTVHILLPMGLLFSRIGAEEIVSLGGLSLTCAGILVVATTLHGHVVCARLICLRPRIFGGEAAIESAMLR